MYLPYPPDISNERYLFIKSGRHSLYSLSIITTAILITGMALFVFINPLFLPYTFFVILSTAYLSISYAIGAFSKDFDHEKHRKLFAKYFDRSATQELDIYLPICNEPLHVLANTWTHVRRLKDLHDAKISVYVLDDGKSEEAKELAKKMKFNYITRETNELKKAGNLRNAFKQTTGEFFVIFDADFCPAPDFLIHTLPYMYENENVGIVQTPQYFETRDSKLNAIEKGSAQIQELFYRLIQVSRDYFNGAICVGTSAVYRRKHLEPHGGTAAIGWSEDVHTAVLIMKDGREVKYIPLILSKGQCPDTWKQFFTQFYRWSTGSLSLMLDKSFWTSRLTIAQKLCFTTGFGFYVTTALQAALAFTPTIYLLIFKPHYIFWFNVLWAVPSLLLTNIYMRFWQKTGYSWSAVQARAVSSYAHLFALVDILFKKTEAWIPTGGKGRSGRYEIFKHVVLYHNLLLGVILLGLILYRHDEIGPFALLPTAFFYTYHIATLWPVIDGKNRQ